MGGHTGLNVQSYVGTMGVPDPAVRPSGLENFDAGYDPGSDTAYIWGGTGKTSLGSIGNLDNMFKWDGTNFTWVYGSDALNQASVYGAKGVTAGTNRIGARVGDGKVLFDKNGMMWKFGSSGYDSAGTIGALSDLWKWDGTDWTWVSGPNLANQAGVYGTKGVAAPENYPGGRYRPGTVFDSSGNLWVFGGYGYDSAGGALLYLNDLWKFDGTNWTWISGSDIGNTAAGVGSAYATYGTKGVAAATNVPGGRKDAYVVIDSQDNIILYSGLGFAESGSSGGLRDIWKFNTNTLEWTWIHGANTAGGATTGVYGTKGLPDPANLPPWVFGAPVVIDAADNLWLFGGSSYNNHLWRFDGTNWTWISGDNVGSQLAVYGTKGTAGALNKPGGRQYTNGWIDNKGDIYIFGAVGYNNTSGPNKLADFWRFQP